MKKVFAITLALILLMVPAVLSEEIIYSDEYVADVTVDVPKSDVTITKTLKGELWQVRCDVMDTTTFIAGGGKWKPDITNAKHNTSKEGHRSNKCGDINNWILWVDENGVAIRLDEIKSGATGGTLPTVVYDPAYELTTEDVQNYDPANIEDEVLNQFKANYNSPMQFSDIELEEGKRIYWTTQNKGQVWHHTGTLHKTRARFTLTINGETFQLGVGDSVTLYDVEDGLLQLDEVATAEYYLGTVLVNGEEVSHDGWSAQIEIHGGEDVEIDWGNVIVTPKPTQSPVPPSPLPTITPTPTATPSLTPTPTATPTATPTVTPSPTPTTIPTDTPEPVVTETPTPEPTYTPRPRPTVTPEPTATPEPIPTPYIDDEGNMWLPIVRPTVEPEKIPVKKPGAWMEIIEDYDTALGVEVQINHVGDCFD